MDRERAGGEVTEKGKNVFFYRKGFLFSVGVICRAFPTETRPFGQFYLGRKWLFLESVSPFLALFDGFTN